MEAGFWREKWQKAEIGFHRSEVNPLLVRHLHELSLEPGSRLFLPLCGKTLDIAWLLSHGFRVAGAELVEMAIEELFADLGTEPEVSESGERRHYRAENIDVFVGDVFDLACDVLGPVDAVYDRAALVALPGPTRGRYAAHVTEITSGVPRLLISYEYDQSRMDGPPFSVSAEEVRRLHEERYDVRLLSSADVPGGLKGRCPAKESTWLMRPRPRAPAGDR